MHVYTKEDWGEKKGIIMSRVSIPYPLNFQSSNQSVTYSISKSAKGSLSTDKLVFSFSLKKKKKNICSFNKIT